MKKNKIILKTLLLFMMTLLFVSSVGTKVFANDGDPMGYEENWDDPAYLTAPETCDTNSVVLLRLERQPYAADFTAKSISFYRSTENSYTGELIATGTAECFPDCQLEPGVYYYYAVAEYESPYGGSYEFLSEIKEVKAYIGDHMFGIIDSLAGLSVPTYGVVGNDLSLQIVSTSYLANECNITGVEFYRNTTNIYDGTLLSEGKKLSYTDNISKPGTYYYYAHVSYEVSKKGASGDFLTDFVAVTINEEEIVTNISFITSIAITNVPTPVAGKPCSTDGIKVTTTPANAGNVNVIYWYDETLNNGSAANGDFIEGHKYSINVQIDPNTGYNFESTSSAAYTGKATINGKKADRAEIAQFGLGISSVIGVARDSQTVYTLVTSVDKGHGTIIPEEIKTIANGDKEIIIFKPDTGYEIDKVTVNGEEIEVLSNVLDVTMDSNKSVVVTYKQIQGNNNNIFIWIALSIVLCGGVAIVIYSINKKKKQTV